MSVRSA